MNATEVIKELFKSKANAQFSHYCHGSLYYTVLLPDGKYRFPIEVVEKQNGTLTLSSDLGTTDFTLFEKGSMLTRWIKKAIESDNFVKVE